MEHFVMKQEYAQHQKQLQEEAQTHSIPPEDIDRLIEETYEQNTSLIPTGIPPRVVSKPTSESIYNNGTEVTPNSARSEREEEEDAELIRLLDIQEEYQVLMDEEQKELEDILSTFSI